MAANNYIVYVPDRSAPFTGFPKTMTVDEVRASLVSTGYTSVETAEAVLESGNSVIRFRRPSGGTKGL